ncbi:hypothetical protein ABT158_47400 [Nonomuraea sp. NPDC001636]|uniref:hypothetical protein n=1 Tax=Nonomuraea sp. NPDC001636 TaxID=3154391 RepID=UPI0033229E7C
MRDQRSGTQILYGFLPEQTGDLRGGVWKSVEWKNPITIDIEDRLIRQRLVEEMEGWVAGGLDPSAVKSLRSGTPIEVVSVNRYQGVRVERFPEVWVCRECRRVQTGKPKRCSAGHDNWQQLHFVGYHECGRLEAPHIPRCPNHHEVRMRHQSSIEASRIVFDCPECQRILQRGLGNRLCPCGRQYSDRRSAKLLTYNVHRAASVYAPQTFVLINPANREQMRRITAGGGQRRALAWVLGGFEGTPDVQRATGSSFVEEMLAKGFPRELAEKLAATAKEAGQLADEDDLGYLADAAGPMIDAAERDAVDIALATSESRIRIPELITENITSEARTVYERDYPAAVLRAGSSNVDLVDRFPVLKAVYGFTRGGLNPGDARLSRFHGKGNSYRVYADLQQAEALMVQLDPMRIYEWLVHRGHRLPLATNERDARAAIAARVDIPNRFTEPGQSQALGEDLLTLTHSYAHRAIRQLAVFAGVDREGLGEYLVPRHCTFFIFAATRGDFVLGGLQAVFENDLDKFLNTLVAAESRCALDPACGRNGGACHACLHLGEPTCGYFNRYLDRRLLFGPHGYLAAMRLPGASPRDDV